MRACMSGECCACVRWLGAEDDMLKRAVSAGRWLTQHRHHAQPIELHDGMMRGVTWWNERWRLGKEVIMHMRTNALGEDKLIDWLVATFIYFQSYMVLWDPLTPKITKIFVYSFETNILLLQYGVNFISCSSMYLVWFMNELLIFWMKFIWIC